MRGIQKQHSIATTSAFTGEFQQDRTRSRVHASGFQGQRLTGGPVTNMNVDEANRFVERGPCLMCAGGGMIILVDDEDRENEGDLFVAAERATAGSD
jgi:hypothetical protein